MQAKGRPQSEGDPESPSPESDRDLVEAVLRKDRKATAELVERFADRVYGYLRTRLYPRPDRAEDLFQETFLAAWQHLAEYRSESALETWLLGIARHKVEDYYRARLRDAEPLDELAEGPIAAPEGEAFFVAVLDDDKRRRRIEAILSGLPEAYALALQWRYWEKRPAREMAEMTGKTEKAVERLLARARRLFRKKWESE